MLELLEDLEQGLPDQWRRKWQPILVFLPGESHGQRSLAGSSLWGHKESDTTEWLSTHTHNVYTEEISLRVEFSIV